MVERRSRSGTTAGVLKGRHTQIKALKWGLDVGQAGKHITTHGPHVLDPLLKGLQDMYGRGITHSTDVYVPDPVLIAKRVKSLQNQSYTTCTTSGQKLNEKYEST